MAASGIAEHHEARRREGVYLRKAFLLREARRAENGGDVLTPCDGASTYDQQVYSQIRQGAGRSHDAATVDRQRRQQHYNQMQQEYSAKISNRYTSIDYASQW